MKADKAKKLGLIDQLVEPLGMCGLAVANIPIGRTTGYVWASCG